MLKRLRVLHVAMKLGISAPDYRLSLNAAYSNPPIPAEHRHLLDDFDAESALQPQRRSLRQAKIPDPRYDCGDYVIAPDEQGFQWKQKDEQPKIMARFAAFL